MLIHNADITGSLLVNGTRFNTGSFSGSFTGAVAGTTATASYVEYNNVANKPALVSGSSQITYSGLTGIPSGIVSGSSQVVYSGLTGIPSGIVSGSSQVTYSGLTGIPSGIVSGSSQVTYSGLSGIPSGILSGSAQIAAFGYATTGSNQFNGNQTITGSLTVTGQVVAQTLNVQQVTSSIVFSSGSNIFGNSLANTQQFTGSVGITGSLTVTTNGVELQVTNTGVNLGNALTDSHIISGSLRVNPSGLFVSGSGNVGINTTTPSERLSVVGAGLFGSHGAGSYSLAISNNDQSNVRLRITNAGSGGQAFSIVGGNPGASNAGLAIYDETNAATRLYISSTGAATFSGSVTATGGTEIPNGQFYRARRSSSNLLIDLLGIESGTDNTRLLITGDFNIKNGSLATLLNMTTAGTTTFLGPTVTIGTAVAATNVKLILNGVASKAAGIEFHQSGTPQWYIGNGIASEDNNFELYNSNGTMAMKIIKSTNAINFIGAATFSSRVGVGGAAATYPLTAYNASNGTTAAFGGTARGIRIDNDGTFSSGRSTIYGVDNTFYGSYQPLAIGGSELYFSISGTDRLTIASTGAATFSSTVTATRGFFSSNAASDSTTGLLANATTNDSSTYAAIFGSLNAGYRMVVRADGNVGIGTILPSAQLNVGHESHGIGMAYMGGSALPAIAGLFTDINSGQTGYGSLLVKARSDFGGFYSINFFTAASNNTPVERMRITSGGVIQNQGGVYDTGGSTTHWIARVRGNDRIITDTTGYVYMPFLTTGSGIDDLGWWSTSGTSWTYNGMLMRISSSARYKKNIRDIEIDTSKIYDLRTISYENNENTAVDGLTSFGLLAEDVAEKIPLLATFNNEGLPEGVQYKMLSVLILEELKKLKAELDAAKAEIQLLKQQ